MSGTRSPRLLAATVVAMFMLAVSGQTASAHAPAAHVALPIKTASSGLSREVFGFAQAGNLADPSVGYPSWNFSLLSTVAFFGLYVNWDGTINNDWHMNVWNSSAMTGLLNTAHASGTKVVATLVLGDFQAGTPNLCEALETRAVTIRQAVSLVAARGVDGVNVDYEGLNTRCPLGDTTRNLLVYFVRDLRAALPAGSYISVDTYASSAGDPAGYYDVPGLSPYTDSFFVMAYDLAWSNYTHAPLNCSSFCLGPAAPVTGYYYTDTVIASQYTAVVPASKVLLGVPYYGNTACVGSASANAYPVTAVTAETYLESTAEASSSAVKPGTYAINRDANDPTGKDRWDTWYNNSLGCTRELYWDDSVSLGAKYDLVNNFGLRGAGIWTLNYGGGANELWSAISSHFARCKSVTLSTQPGSQAGVGATVTVSAQASGCPTPQYQFWVLRPGATSYQLAQAYSSSSTLSWSTAGLAPGMYRFSVWARDSNSTGAGGNSFGTWDTYSSAAYTLTSCSGVGVSSAPVAAARVGTAVTITARSSGCASPLYQFWVLAPGAASYQLAQAYSATATLAWSTASLQPGAYRFSVWTRDANSSGAFSNTSGSWDAYNTLAYNLTTCSSVSGTASPASPVSAGATVTLSATAAGCPSPSPVYQFWVLAPGASAYQLVQAYSSSPTFIWSTTGLAAGTYRFSIWARDANSSGASGNAAGRWDVYYNAIAYTVR